jgi:hypothetical protein
MEDFNKAVKGYSEKKLKIKCKWYAPSFKYASVEDWLVRHKLDTSWHGIQFDLDSYHALKNIFNNYKVAYFHTEIAEYRSKHSIELYPSLSSLQFYKVFDSFAAYQEIETFLCNVLVEPDNPYIEPIPDVIKTGSKGFDKFSFRKEKSQKKERG